MKKIAIAFWATGKYLEMVPECWEYLEENFIPEANKTYFVHTDGELESAPDNIVKVEIPDYGFPETFNKTFEVYSNLQSHISDYDWLMSFDVDLRVNKTISYDEFFDDTKKYFGVHHPCHYFKMAPHNTPPGAFDINPKSNACVKDILDMSVYWQGCLWGGKVTDVFEMINVCDSWVKGDVENGVQAKYFEESYFNKWFIQHRDETNTLSSDYAFPQMFEKQMELHLDKKIVHLYKDNKSYGNNLW